MEKKGLTGFNTNNMSEESKPAGESPGARREVNKKEKGPKYSSGGEKIKAEAEAEYKAAKGKEAKAMMEGQMAPIIQYITEKCEADPKYNTLVLQEHKTWKRCYDFMMKKARTMAAKGSNGLLVEGETILKWIDEYYKKNDKAQFEKKKEKNQKPAEEKKKEVDKTAQKAKEKPEPDSEALGKWLVEKSETKPAEEKKGDQDLEKQESNVDEQIDMFSVFNV